MLFNSYFFIFIFLPIFILTIYFAENFFVKNKKILFIFLSIIFYAYWSIPYLLLLCISIVFNYLTLRYLIKNKDKFILIIGIFLNLVNLIVFKYTNFILDTFSYSNFSILNDLVLPIGISFYTFQQISALVDYFRGNRKTINFIDYFLYIIFFPQLIAGPIIRTNIFFSQIKKLCLKKNFLKNIEIGLSLFILGLFKKVFIADYFGSHSDIIFTSLSNDIPITFWEAWFGILSFSFQIYFDLVHIQTWQ